MGDYTIRVRGHLDDRWGDWFGDLAITRLPDGDTELRGELPDQAALHGVLARVRDLGLALLAVSSAGQTVGSATEASRPP